MLELIPIMPLPKRAARTKPNAAEEDVKTDEVAPVTVLNIEKGGGGSVNQRSNPDVDTNWTYPRGGRSRGGGSQRAWRPSDGCPYGLSSCVGCVGRDVSQWDGVVGTD